MGNYQEHQSIEGAKYPWGAKKHLEIWNEVYSITLTWISQVWHYTYWKVILSKTTWGVGGKRCFEPLNCLLRKMWMCVLKCRVLVSLRHMQIRGQNWIACHHTWSLSSQLFLHATLSFLNKPWTNTYLKKKIDTEWLVALGTHTLQAAKGWGKRDHHISGGPSKYEAEAYT